MDRTAAYRYCYFADYEIFMGGGYREWGQTTLDYRVADAEAFDPARVLALVRERAAAAHGVGSSAVRVRTLQRL